MAAVGSRGSLKGLLDGMLISQKKDIYAFSGGHLNERNLRKQPHKATRGSWESARTGRNLACSEDRQPKDASRKKEAMADCLLSFSVGTTGAVPLPPVTKQPLKSTRVSLKLLSDQDSESLKTKTIQPGQSSEKANKLPMLYQKNDSCDTTVGFGEVKHVDPPSSDKRSKPLLETNAQYLLSCQEATTKRDQFHRLKTFETDFLRPSAKEKQMLPAGVAEKLESKLRDSLASLKRETGDPCVNLSQLEIFSDVFDELMDNVFFSPVFRQIKTEYDSYIAHLLTKQPDGQQKLRDQMEQLSARGPTNPKVLNFEADRLFEMEMEAEDLLRENRRLRREVDYELGVVEETDEGELNVTIPAAAQPPKVQLATHVEELHAALLEKLDQIAEIRNDLQTNYVPAKVCNHLEQCVKETEVQIQRLTSQKEYYDKSIAEMEAQLQQLIETADTTEKDAKRVWKRINAVKAISRGGQLVFGYDSDSENDEEAKWNWYIS